MKRRDFLKLIGIPFFANTMISNEKLPIKKEILWKKFTEEIPKIGQFIEIKDQTGSIALAEVISKDCMEKYLRIFVTYCKWINKDEYRDKCKNLPEHGEINMEYWTWKPYEYMFCGKLKISEGIEHLYS